MSTLISESQKAVETVSDRERSATHRVHLLITKDDEDLYSAIALNLPGAGGSGATEEAALENARKAISAVLEAYGDPIPWEAEYSTDAPAGSRLQWITVDA